ncbi:hypothetical protein IGI37_002903 [Enterococcus sp. AZ194]
MRSADGVASVPTVYSDKEGLGHNSTSYVPASKAVDLYNFPLISFSSFLVSLFRYNYLGGNQQELKSLIEKIQISYFEIKKSRGR